MSLEWTDKVDGIDYAVANDINSIVHEVIDLSETKADVEYVDGKISDISASVDDLKETDEAVSDSLSNLNYYGDMNVVPTDSNCFEVTLTMGTLTPEGSSGGSTAKITGLTSNASGLTEIVIPYDLADTIEVGNGVFQDNASLKSVIFPNNVKTIGNYMFCYSGNLEYVRFPDSVDSFDGEGMFGNCSSLTSVVLPKGVTSIAYYMFQYCSNLVSVTLPDGVKNIGFLGFFDCSNLVSVNLPYGVKTIGDGAFYGCGKLEHLVLPDTVTSVALSFGYCTNLTSLTVPKSVTSITDDAFASCPNLTIRCPQGSYTETYAKTNGIKYVYTDLKTSDIVNTLPDGALVPGTTYDLGVQRNLSFTLPEGELGDVIKVEFISGINTTTLTIEAEDGVEFSALDFEIKGNTVYSLMFEYGPLNWNPVNGRSTYGWRSSYSEYDSKITYSWSEIRSIIRYGYARRYLDIGDTLTVSRNDEEIAFDVIGFDRETLIDSSFQHSMTLQMSNPTDLTNICFDESEATWYIDEATYPNGLAADTYLFKLPDGYETELGGGKTYSFTLQKDVPVGGQIEFKWSWGEKVTACKIITRERPGDLNTLETANISEIQEDVAASNYMPDIQKNTATANTNALLRNRFGSNQWSKSTVRQWLNSDKSAGEWWEAKNVFDIATEYFSKDGFLNGFDPKFLGGLAQVIKKTQESITDGGEVSEDVEKVFLLSDEEVFCHTSEEVAYEYYGAEHSDHSQPNSAADKNRVKYYNENAVGWYLRTAGVDVSHNVSAISDSGSLAGSSAYVRSTKIVPACVIA